MNRPKGTKMKQKVTVPIVSFVLNLIYPPKCGICGKSFANKNVLNKHINAIHKNIASFQCLYPECRK